MASLHPYTAKLAAKWLKQNCRNSHERYTSAHEFALSRLEPAARLPRHCRDRLAVGRGPRAWPDAADGGPASGGAGTGPWRAAVRARGALSEPDHCRAGIVRVRALDERGGQPAL